jgi:hypothetical protein
MRAIMPTVPLLLTALVWPLSAAAVSQQAAAAGSMGPAAWSALEQKARRAGGRLQEVVREDAVVPATTIQDLAARTPDIVIGQVLARRGHLTPDGTATRTDIILKVQQSVRGEARAGELITIAIPGGSYRFPDGSTATQYREFYRPVRDQERYLFFLQRSPDGLALRGDVAYEWAVGPQGQFELNFAEDKVLSGTIERGHPIKTRYDGSSVKALLLELRAATRP